jgi:hypothetical protein
MNEPASRLDCHSVVNGHCDLAYCLRFEARKGSIVAHDPSFILAASDDRVVNAQLLTRERRIQIFSKFRFVVTLANLLD